MDDQLPTLRPQHQLIYEAFREREAPATDTEMGEFLEIPGSSFRPRRRELADRGYLECAGDRRTPQGRSAALWRAVPLERVAEVRAANERRKPRRRTVEDFSLDEKVEAVRLLLRDDAVNERLRTMQGGSWSRARGRARSTRAKEERRLQTEIAEAERERDASVDFLKAKRNLVRAIEVVRGVERFVVEDLDRRASNERVRIATEHWPEVADHLADVATSAAAAEELIRDRLGLSDDVIDVQGFDVEEVLELTDGDES